ncbi:MAG: RES family NAD+ phosphorylase [Thermoanaerobaculia bacterium]
MSTNLAALPYRELVAASRLYRIHGSGHGPWSFGATGDNRFDPVGADGVGAAYWAEDPLAAWVEVFRTRMRLTEREVATRTLSVVALEAPLRVCDLTQRGALRAGVAAALTAGHDYSEAQELALHLVDRCGGARWRVRHDLAGELIGVALSGPLGDAAPSGMSPPSSVPIPQDLVARAEQEFGYLVLPEPRTMQ